METEGGICVRLFYNQIWLYTNLMNKGQGFFLTTN